MLRRLVLRSKLLAIKCMDGSDDDGGDPAPTRGEGELIGDVLIQPGIEFVVVVGDLAEQCHHDSGAPILE